MEVILHEVQAILQEVSRFSGFVRVEREFSVVYKITGSECSFIKSLYLSLQ